MRRLSAECRRQSIAPAKGLGEPRFAPYTSGVDSSARDQRIDARAERLRPHYQRFLASRPQDILLTAHSHQAWPDVSRDAHLQAWDDAARWVDDKWGHVFDEVLPTFQKLVTKRLGSARPSDLAVAPNSHELVARLLSCFPADARVVTTDREFHSLRRQLTRSMEDGLRVDAVAVPEDGGLAPWLLEAVDREPTHLVALSLVFFTNAQVVTDLEVILAGLADRNIPALVDAYHAFNVLELAVDRWPGTVFVTGGGYKYAQTGEGACWMLVPPDAARFRPAHTGWFADFASLEDPDGTTGYGPGGQRFFGATFDPTPFYRGRAVLRWMDEVGLSPRELFEAAVDGTSRIIELYDELELSTRGLQLATPRDPERRGGFVSFRHPDARGLKAKLRSRGVWTDARQPLLRLGPAPYTTSRELRTALHELADLL